MNFFKSKISKKDAHKIVMILMTYKFDDIIIDLENDFIIASAKFDTNLIFPSIEGVDENSKIIINPDGNIRIVNKKITIGSDIRQLETLANLGLPMDTKFDPGDMIESHVIDFELMMTFFGYSDKNVKPSRIPIKVDELEMFLTNNCSKNSNTVIRIKKSDRLCNLRCSFEYKNKHIYNALVNVTHDTNPIFSVSLDWESSVVNPPNFKKIDFMDYLTIESLQNQTYNLYIRNKVDYNLRIPTWNSLNNFIEGLDFINPKFPIRKESNKFKILYTYFKLLENRNVGE